MIFRETFTPSGLEQLVGQGFNLEDLFLLFGFEKLSPYEALAQLAAESYEQLATQAESRTTWRHIIAQSITAQFLPFSDNGIDYPFLSYDQLAVLFGVPIPLDDQRALLLTARAMAVLHDEAVFETVINRLFSAYPEVVRLAEKNLND